MAAEVRSQAGQANAGYYAANEGNLHHQELAESAQVLTETAQVLTETAEGADHTEQLMININAQQRELERAQEIDDDEAKKIEL